MQRLLKTAKANYSIILNLNGGVYKAGVPLASVKFTNSADGKPVYRLLYYEKGLPLVLQENPTPGTQVIFEVTDLVRSDYSSEDQSIYKVSYPHVLYKDTTNVDLLLTRGPTPQSSIANLAAREL
jgi:hypothetical protein